MTHLIFLDFDDKRNPMLGAGQAVSTFEIGRRLVKMGYQVTVVSSRFPGSNDRWEQGIYYHHIGLSSKYLRLNNLCYILSLPFIVRRLKADLIIECFTAPISTLFTPLFTRIPVVAVPTSFDALRFARLYHFPFHWLEKLGLPLYRYFLPYSRESLEKMQALNPDIIYHTIGLGVDMSLLANPLKKPTHILYLGRIDFAQKGLDLLICAYSLVSQKIRFPLVIAGHGPDFTRLQKLIDHAGLQHKISLVGSAYGQDKLRLFSQSAVTVVPSRQEGFCLSALESLACGVPIVCFRIPGLSWLTDQVAWKARPFDPADLAHQLLTAIHIQTTHPRTAACRKTARTFSWDRVVTGYHRFFQDQVLNPSI